MRKRYQISTAVLVRKLLPATCVATAAFAVGAAHQAAATVTPPVNINPLGDSITFGTNDVAAEIGGYRFYFEDLASSNPLFNLNFIGNRTEGTGSDTEHWGVPGAQAQRDRDLGTDLPGMLRAVHNITDATVQSTTPELAAFDPANGKLDAMFIHAGTNSVPGPIETTTGSQNKFGTDNAFDGMKNLLLAGSGVSANATGATASFPTINNANGVHAQLSNSSVANAQSHVFVAGIIPLFEDFGLQGGSLLNTYNGIGDYNSKVKNLLDTDTTLNDAGSSVTYHYVDMFSITVDELDLNWLAGLFTDTDNNVTQQDIDDLIDLISPDAEVGGTDYVDWGLGFNEATWDEGALGTDETVYTGFNTNILGDRKADEPGEDPSGIHPTDLGYAIMANVWYNAAAPVLVPEPSSMLLILAGSTLMFARRRRSA